MFLSSYVFSIVDVLHTVINSVRAILANRASHLSCNSFFSRGYDPYAHACEARPLTTVGRTSLSVITIIINLMAFKSLPSFTLRQLRKTSSSVQLDRVEWSLTANSLTGRISLPNSMSTSDSKIAVCSEVKDVFSFVRMKQCVFREFTFSFRSVG